MNRFKFRIWDKKNNIFIYEWDASHKRLAISLNGLVYSGMYDDVLPENDYTIQQYTGLKDSKGNEIYEGDILMPDTIDGIWPEQRNGVMVKDIRQPFANAHLFKIVGNIMQNPELIKNKRRKFSIIKT